MNACQGKTRELRFIAHVPQPLLDYLWDWGTTLNHGDAEQAVFSLSPVIKGGAEAQEIRLELDGMSETREISGFAPVRAELQMDYSGGACVMHLISWDSEAEAS